MRAPAFASVALMMTSMARAATPLITDESFYEAVESGANVLRAPGKAGENDPAIVLIKKARIVGAQEDMYLATTSKLREDVATVLLGAADDAEAGAVLLVDAQCATDVSCGDRRYCACTNVPHCRDWAAPRDARSPFGSDYTGGHRSYSFFTWHDGVHCSLATVSHICVCSSLNRYVIDTYTDTDSTSIVRSLWTLRWCLLFYICVHLS